MKKAILKECGSHFELAEEETTLLWFGDGFGVVLF